MIGIKDQYFGTEIEMTGITRQRAAEVVAEMFGTEAYYDGTTYGVWSVIDLEGKKWKFMSDGSIYTQRKVYGRIVDAGGEYSTEMVSPKLSYDEMGKLQEVVRCLLSAYMKEVYARICREQNTTDNPAFYEALIQNYIYKGPVVEWYIRIKVKMEKNYRLFNRLIPVQGQITDIGCGFGPLCYMLSLLSEDREILGIDYDEDKIALAQHGWLRNEHLQFKHGNALEYPLPESDVFILNDMLHYMSYEHQQTLLLKCAGRLRSQGMIIIRDGNSANASKHRLTRFTELLSTRIFNFNRTTGELYFTTETQLREIAVTCGMAVEIIPNDKYTSNTIYIFRKPN